ncbi:metallophosphoesterase family protein [Vagococcus sp. BWB3-3]|uniref:Metallophosphoesterase family protein n=1 Tax=Vagococcus allomyrinae TaxID=2794353 RepID=A0A940PDS5_9ENTE|nr:metallophosphoesterase family protein [Vagococcus allomyrinae]MBP1042722.1 metallophosphoesterase family protein [Vagococcus allomyrinae]
MIYGTDSLKILQLTDIHLGATPFNEEDQKSLRKIEESLVLEQPDLICLTGDQIWSEGVTQPEKAYYALIEVLNRFDIPVVVTYGNHDSEEGITRQELRAMELRIKNLAEKQFVFIDPRDREAFTVELFKGEVLTNVLYVFDTGAMAPMDFDSYDWVSAEQIDWYEKTFSQYRQKYGVTRDLAFMHIPLPEYEQAAEQIVDGYFWEQNPRIAAPKLNTGLFSRLVFNQHVTHIFCGHDHDNNFEGAFLGIKCVYGNVSGYNCYGVLPRGYRLISVAKDRIETELKQYQR